MTLKAKKIVEFEIKIMHFKSIKLKNVSLKSFSTIGRNFFRWHCPFKGTVPAFWWFLICDRPHLPVQGTEVLFAKFDTVLLISSFEVGKVCQTILPATPRITTHKNKLLRWFEKAASNETFYVRFLFKFIMSKHLSHIFESQKNILIRVRIRRLPPGILI